jgi:hypothetical protein
MFRAERQLCPDRRRFSGCDLEDVSDARSGEHHSHRRQPDDPDDTVRAIQHDRVDREPHAEGVDRPTVREEQALAGRKSSATDQPSGAFTSRFRDRDAERTEPRTLHAAGYPA